MTLTDFIEGFNKKNSPNYTLEETTHWKWTIPSPSPYVIEEPVLDYATNVKLAGEKFYERDFVTPDENKTIFIVRSIKPNAGLSCDDEWEAIFDFIKGDFSSLRKWFRPGIHFIKTSIELPNPNYKSKYSDLFLHPANKKQWKLHYPSNEEFAAQFKEMTKDIRENSAKLPVCGEIFKGKSTVEIMKPAQEQFNKELQQAWDKSKYFTPAIEDLRRGYDCEILRDTTYEGHSSNEWHHIRWEPLKISTGFNFYTICLETLRVPYLTKEQIEKEGWKLPVSVTGALAKYKSTQIFGIPFIKNGWALWLAEDHNIIIAWFGGVYPEQIRFLGFCPDINEFRRITHKYLNIK